MDFNLPLILFILVVATGVIWVFDIFVLSNPRKAAVANVDSQFGELTNEQKVNHERYNIAVEKVSQEPAVVEFAKSFFPLLLVVFIVRSFLIEPFQIPSESMLPTLEVGDFLAVNKFAYGIRLPVIDKKIINVGDPQRGDVMVFVPPNDPRYFIKRVIGLPGDKISVINNTFYVNDKEIPKTFIKTIAANPQNDNCYTLRGKVNVYEETLNGKTYTTHRCSVPGPLGRNYSAVVPEGHYFMMGDNRDNSADSRDWGMQPDVQVVGKAFVIWMHWDKLFSVPSFSRAGKL